MFRKWENLLKKTIGNHILVGFNNFLQFFTLFVDLINSYEYDFGSVLGTDSRGVAQSGSAPALGAGCREFESLHPDQSGLVNRLLMRP